MCNKQPQDFNSCSVKMIPIPFSIIKTEEPQFLLQAALSCGDLEYYTSVTRVVPIPHASHNIPEHFSQTLCYIKARFSGKTSKLNSPSLQ